METCTHFVLLDSDDIPSLLWLCHLAVQVFLFPCPN